jgi:hypothetical protein
VCVALLLLPRFACYFSMTEAVWDDRVSLYVEIKGLGRKWSWIAPSHLPRAE